MAVPGRLAAIRHGSRRFVLESEDSMAQIPVQGGNQQLLGGAYSSGQQAPRRRVLVARPVRDGEDLSHARAVAPPLASGASSPIRSSSDYGFGPGSNALGVSHRPDSSSVAAIAGAPASRLPPIHTSSTRAGVGMGAGVAYGAPDGKGSRAGGSSGISQQRTVGIAPGPVKAAKQRHVRARTADSLAETSRHLKQEEDKRKDRHRKGLLIHERVRAGREERARARWEKQQREWRDVRSKVAARVGREEGATVVARSEEWREVQEELDVLDKAVPDEEKKSGDGWEMSLRGGGQRFIQIGNIFNALYVPVKTKGKPMAETVRRPARATGGRRIHVAEGSVHTHTTTSTEAVGKSAYGKTWRDAPAMRRKRRQLEDRIKKLRPHEVSADAADGLVIEGRDLLQWARRSVGVGGFSSSVQRPQDGVEGRPGSVDAGEEGGRPRRPSLRVVEGLMEGRALGDGAGAGGTNMSGFGGLKRAGSGRMRDFASDEGSDDEGGDMAQATAMMDGIDELLGGTRAARGADPGGAGGDGESPGGVYAGRQRADSGAAYDGFRGGYDDEDQGPLPGANLFFKVTRDAFTHPSASVPGANTIEASFGATGTLRAGEVRDPSMGTATWGHAQDASGSLVVHGEGGGGIALTLQCEQGAGTLGQVEIVNTGTRAVRLRWKRRPALETKLGGTDSQAIQLVGASSERGSVFPPGASKTVRFAVDGIVPGVHRGTWELRSVPAANGSVDPVVVVNVKATVLEDDTTGPRREGIERHLYNAVRQASEREELNLQRREEAREVPAPPQGAELLELQMARFESRNGGLHFAPNAFAGIEALAEEAHRKQIEMQGGDLEGGAEEGSSSAWKWDCFVASVSRSIASLECPEPNAEEAEVLRLREAHAERAAKESAEADAGGKGKKGGKKADKKSSKGKKGAKGAAMEDEPDEEELQLQAEQRALQTPTRYDVLPRWKDWAQRRLAVLVAVTAAGNDVQAPDQVSDAEAEASRLDAAEELYQAEGGDEPSAAESYPVAPASTPFVASSAADFDPSDPEPTVEREVGRIAAERAAAEKRRLQEEAEAEAASSKKKGKVKGKKGAAEEEEAPVAAAPSGPFVPLPSLPPVRPAYEQSPLYPVVRDLILRIAAAVPLASEAARVRAGLLPRGAEDIMDYASKQAEERWTDRVQAAEKADERIPRAEERAHKAWALEHQARKVAEGALPVASENERHSSQGLRGADISGGATGAAHGVADEVQAILFGGDGSEGRMMRRVLRLVKAVRGVEDDEDEDSDDLDDDSEEDEEEAEEPEGGDIAGYDVGYAAAAAAADEAAEAAKKAAEAARLAAEAEAEAAAAGGKGKKGKKGGGKGKGSHADAAADEAAAAAAGAEAEAAAAASAEPGPPLSTGEEKLARQRAVKTVSALLSNGASVIHRAGALFARRPNTQRVVGEADLCHALAHLHQGDASGALIGRGSSRIADRLLLDRRATLEEADVRGRAVVLRADLDLPLFPDSAEQEGTYWDDSSAPVAGLAARSGGGVASGYDEEEEEDAPDSDSVEGNSVLRGGRRAGGGGGKSVVSGMTKGTARTAATSATSAGGLKAAGGAGVVETPYVQPQGSQLARHPLLRSLKQTVEDLAARGAACVVVVGRQGTMEPPLPHRLLDAEAFRPPLHGAAAAVAASLDAAEVANEEKAGQAAARKHGESNAGFAAAIRLRGKRRAARAAALQRVGLPSSVLLSRASAGGVLARLPSSVATKAAMCAGVAGGAAAPAEASAEAETSGAPSSGAGADPVPDAPAGSTGSDPVDDLVQNAAACGDFKPLPGATALPLHLSPFSGGKTAVPPASLRPAAAALRSALPSVSVAFVGAREAAEAGASGSDGVRGGLVPGAGLAASVLDRARELARQHVETAAAVGGSSGNSDEGEETAQPPCAVVFVENLLLLDAAAVGAAQPIGELAGPSYESWNGSDLVVAQGRERRWVRQGVPAPPYHGGMLAASVLQQMPTSQWPPAFVSLWVRGAVASAGYDGARAGLAAASMAASHVDGARLLRLRIDDLGVFGLNGHVAAAVQAGIVGLVARSQRQESLLRSEALGTPAAGGAVDPGASTGGAVSPAKQLSRSRVAAIGAASPATGGFSASPGGASSGRGPSRGFSAMSLLRKRAALSFRAAALQAGIASLGSVLVVDDAAAAHSADPGALARPLASGVAGPRSVAGPSFAATLQLVGKLLRGGSRDSAWTAQDSEEARLAQKAASHSTMGASMAASSAAGGQGPVSCELGVQRPVVFVLGGGPAALERQVAQLPRVAAVADAIVLGGLVGCAWRAHAASVAFPGTASSTVGAEQFYSLRATVRHALAVCRTRGVRCYAPFDFVVAPAVWCPCVPGMEDEDEDEYEEEEDPVEEEKEAFHDLDSDDDEGYDRLDVRRRARRKRDAALVEAVQRARRLRLGAGQPLRATVRADACSGFEGAGAELVGAVSWQYEGASTEVSVEGKEGVVSVEGCVVDVGSSSRDAFVEVVEGAGTLAWLGGTMGVAEVEDWQESTAAVVQAVVSAASKGAEVLVSGGAACAAVARMASGSKASALRDVVFVRNAAAVRGMIDGSAAAVRALDTLARPTMN